MLNKIIYVFYSQFYLTKHWLKSNLLPVLNLIMAQQTTFKTQFTDAQQMDISMNVKIVIIFSMMMSSIVIFLLISSLCCTLILQRHFSQQPETLESGRVLHPPVQAGLHQVPGPSLVHQTHNGQHYIQKHPDKRHQMKMKTTNLSTVWFKLNVYFKKHA